MSRAPVTQDELEAVRQAIQLAGTEFVRMRDQLTTTRSYDVGLGALEDPRRGCAPDGHLRAFQARRQSR